MIEKIISGGQTGVDRAALDAAREKGIPYGGALPRGRRTENGPLPAEYTGMTELPTVDYPARTRKNVQDADATLAFSFGKPDRGTALTLGMARLHGKPGLLIDLAATSDYAAVKQLREWLTRIHPSVLNVAGSRESRSPGIYLRVFNLLVQVLPRKKDIGDGLKIIR